MNLLMVLLCDASINFFHSLFFKTDISTRVSKTVTTKTSKRRSKNSVEGDSPSDAEGELGPSGQDKSEVSENPEVPNEPSSSLRRMPRPGSARPAPPRVKRQESVEVLTTDRWGPRHRAGLGGARAERWGREGSRWCWEDLLSRKRQTRLGPDLRPHASLTFQMGERGKHMYSCMCN